MKDPERTPLEGPNDTIGRAKRAPLKGPEGELSEEPKGPCWKGLVSPLKGPRGIFGRPKLHLWMVLMSTIGRVEGRANGLHWKSRIGTIRTVEVTTLERLKGHHWNGQRGTIIRAKVSIDRAERTPMEGPKGL